MGLDNIFDKMKESCGNKVLGTECPKCKEGKLKVTPRDSFKEELVCKDCGYEAVRQREETLPKQESVCMGLVVGSRPLGLREIATNDSFGFAISTSDQNSIEDYAENAGVELTDEVWAKLSDDIMQIERNTLDMLSETYGVARDEGHDRNDSLIGTLFPIKDEAVAELTELADDDEPISTGKGDIFNYLKGSDRDLYKNTSEYSNLIDVAIQIF